MITASHNPPGVQRTEDLARPGRAGGLRLGAGGAGEARRRAEAAPEAGLAPAPMRHGLAAA